MNVGYVKTVLLAKGFGFIAVVDRPDLFFHASELSDGLEFDERLRERRVRFEVVDSPKGPRAVTVQPVH